MKNNKLKRTSFSRVLVAGLFCGVATAVIANVYFFFYKGVTGVEPSWLFNPIIILISVPVATTLASIVYYMTVNYFKKGERFYIGLSVAIALISMIFLLNFQPSDERPLVTVTDGLLLGIMVITYIAICIFLPYLIHHPQIYRTYHQANWYKHNKP